MDSIPRLLVLGARTEVDDRRCRQLLLDPVFDVSLVGLCWPSVEVDPEADGAPRSDSSSLSSHSPFCAYCPVVGAPQLMSSARTRSGGATEPSLMMPSAYPCAGVRTGAAGAGAGAAAGAAGMVDMV
jgi:hypothetical protein